MIPSLESKISGLRPRLHVVPCRLILRLAQHVRPHDLTESNCDRIQSYPLNEQEAHRISCLHMTKSSCTTWQRGPSGHGNNCLSRYESIDRTNKHKHRVSSGPGPCMPHGGTCEPRLSFDSTMTIWRATYSKAFTVLRPLRQNEIINSVLDLGAPQSEVKWL